MQRMLNIEENGGAIGNHNIYVHVFDANGNPLDGVVICRIYALQLQPPDPHACGISGETGPGRVDRESLVRLAYRFLWNYHDAEDAVQEALIAAQAKGGQLKDRGKWASWLYRIVVQRCLLFWRQGKAWRKAADGFVDRQAQQSGPDGVASRSTN